MAAQLSDFGKRLTLAKAHGGFKTDGDLAKAISMLARKDIPPQTVQRLKNSGESVYTPHIAEVCRVRAIWLAEGEGSMIEKGVIAPKYYRMIEDFKILPRECQETVLGFVRLLKRLANNNNNAKSA